MTLGVRWWWKGVGRDPPDPPGWPGHAADARGRGCLPCPRLTYGSAEFFPRLGMLANWGYVTLCPAPILQNGCTRGHGTTRPGVCDPQAASALKRGPDPFVAP